MREVRGDVGLLSDKLSGLSRIGRNLTFGLTVPLVAAGTAAVNFASQFDAAMANVRSIQQMTNSEFADLSNQVLNFGAQIRSGPQAAAESLYTVFSSGINVTSEALALMEQSAFTAEAGLADLNTTTEALTALILAYGRENITAAEASDMLTRTVQVGVGEMGEFASAIGLVIPDAVALGVEVNQLGAHWAFLTQQGSGASRSATNLAGVMRKLLKPTEKMSEAFQVLGVASGRELLQIHNGDLRNALLAVNDALGDTPEALAEAFNEVRAARAARTFINNIDAYTASVDEFNEAVEGATMVAHEEQMKSFAAQVDLTTSALRSAAIVIGDKIMPHLFPFLNVIRELALSVTRLPAPVLSSAVAFAAAAAAVGPLIWGLTSLISPLTLIVGAVVGLGTLYQSNFGGMKDAIQEASTAITGPLDTIKTAVLGFFADVFDPAEIPDFTDVIGEIMTPAEGFGTIEIPIEAGVYLWNLYYRSDFTKDLQRLFTYEDFLARSLDSLGVSDARLIQAGSVLSLPVPIEGRTRMDQWKFDRWIDNVNLERWAEEGRMTVGERVGQAFTQAWGIVKPAIYDLMTKIRDWVLDTGLPTALNIGSQLMTTIAGWFTVEGGEGTEIQTGIEELFEGNFLAAIDAVAPRIGQFLRTELIEKISPQLAASWTAFKTSGKILFTNLGNWLIEVGVPTLSRAFGTVMGEVAAAIAGGIGSLFNSIMGGDAENEANAVVDSAIQPFFEGFTGAIGDADLSIGETVIAAIAGSIATAATLSYILPIIGGIGPVFVGAVRAAMLAGSMTIAFTTKVAAPFVMKIGTSIAMYIRGTGFAFLTTTIGAALAGVVAGIIIYKHMSQSQRDWVGQAVLDVFVPGDQQIDEWRAGLEDSLLTGIAAIGGLIDDEFARSLRADREGGAAAPEAIAQRIQSIMDNAANMVGFDASLITVGLDEDEMWLTVPEGAGADFGLALRQDLAASIAAGEFDMSNEMAVAATDMVSDLGIAIAASDTGHLLTAFAESIPTDLAGKTIAKELAVATITPMEAAFAEAVAAGEGSPEQISETLVAPIRDAMVDAFAAPSGVAYVALTDFFQHYSTTYGNMVAVSATMGPIISASVGGFAAALNHSFLIIKRAANDADFAIRALIGSILRLHALEAGGLVPGNTDFGGTRAAGGPVRANEYYIVGEQGPELFSPGTPGHIIPTATAGNGSAGSSTYIDTLLIEEAHDMETILFELRKLGIDLQRAGR